MVSSISQYLVLFVLAIIVSVIVIIVVSIKKNKSNNQNWRTINNPANNAIPTNPPQTEPDDANLDVIEDKIKIPFERKYLLTKNEYYFYKELKKIADKYNLTVLSKIRFADIVQVKNSEIESKSEWYSNFGKIKSRHIDFALANPENLFVMLIVELDDNSHYSEQARIRDAFIDSVLEKCGYKIIRTKGPNNLENQIVEMLNLSKDNNNV